MRSPLRTLTPALHITLLRHKRTDVRSCNPPLTSTWGRKLDMGRASSSSPFSSFALSGNAETSWTADLEALGLFSSCGEGLPGGRAMMGTFTRQASSFYVLRTTGLHRPPCEIPTQFVRKQKRARHSHGAAASPNRCVDTDTDSRISYFPILPSNILKKRTGGGAQ